MQSFRKEKGRQVFVRRPVSYVSVRDDMTDEELNLSSSSQAEQPHRSRFSRLVDYATRLRNESFVALVDVMKDGCEWVNFMVSPAFITVLLLKLPLQIWSTLPGRHTMRKR